MSINENHSFLMQSKEILWNAGKGAALGGAVVTVLNPLLYAKNRWMTNQKFIPAHCMRGVSLNAATVIPQAFIVIPVNELIKNIISQVNGERELTNSEKAAAGVVSGMLSGAISTPFEFIVQNIHGGWQSSYKQVISQAIKLRGIGVIFTGALALSLREGVYAPGYTFGSHWLSRKFAPYIESDKAKKVIGAGAAGLVVGAVTTPFDNLRANIQFMARNWGYATTIKNTCFGIFAGITARMGACAIATILMTLGTSE